MIRLLHRPGDKLLVHHFPLDMPPGDAFSVEIGGVENELLNVTGSVIGPFARQKNQKRLQRFTEVEMEFGQEVVAHQLQVNLTTSEVFLIGQIHSALVSAPQILVPKRSSLSTYYLRKEKKKLLHAYFQGAGHPFISIDRVLEQYDRAYCVDTNTAINRRGQKVAVTIALSAKSKRIADAAVHVGSDATIQTVAHDPPAGNPELHGIWSVLGFLLKEHPKMMEGRLALITDTELGMVKSWNERSSAFYDGHVLPDDIDIFYATADAGGEEFMPNRLMRACDSLSAQKLREVLAADSR